MLHVHKPQTKVMEILVVHPNSAPEFIFIRRWATFNIINNLQYEDYYRKYLKRTHYDSQLLISQIT